MSVSDVISSSLSYNTHKKLIRFKQIYPHISLKEANNVVFYQHALQFVADNEIVYGTLMA